MWGQCSDACAARGFLVTLDLLHVLGLRVRVGSGARLSHQPLFDCCRIEREASFLFTSSSCSRSSLVAAVVVVVGRRPFSSSSTDHGWPPQALWECWLAGSGRPWPLLSTARVACSIWPDTDRRIRAAHRARRAREAGQMGPCSVGTHGSLMGPCSVFCSFDGFNPASSQRAIHEILPENRLNSISVFFLFIPCILLISM